MKFFAGAGHKRFAMFGRGEPLVHVETAPVVTDRPAFDVEAAYVEHSAFIGRLIQRLTGDGPHVDDILQETFIVAFKKRREFRGEATTRTWLYAIAARMCMRHRRAAHRFDRLRARVEACDFDAKPLSDERPDRELDRARSAALVRAVLDELPFAQREAFVLFELEGLSGQQIAELIGVPLGTVWTRLHHGRETFQKLVRARLAKEAR